LYEHVSARAARDLAEDEAAPSAPLAPDWVDRFLTRGADIGEAFDMVDWDLDEDDPNPASQAVLHWHAATADNIWIPGSLRKRLRDVSDTRGASGARRVTEDLPLFARPSLIGPSGGRLSEVGRHEIEIAAQQVSARLLEQLAHDPQLLYRLNPRQFEEVIAELFEREGYDVTLTAQTRDGGADLFVLDRRVIGSFLYVVECKRYGAHRPVGVGLVRQLYGVVQATRATAGILATTSFFTRDAHSLQRDLCFQLSLRDFSALSQWLRGDGVSSQHRSV
jgi:Restriction endonuclease